ncbi:MAG: hypothetical protein K2Q18_03660 [Bdellovibrionales bacterium]|nr:hypothetical protein [Bdellovibrionales bacterium]
MRLRYTDIENNLFSPGDIFWIRKEGKRSLITKKGDAFNYDLIKKLDEADHELFIEDEDYNFYKILFEFFTHYNQSLLMKEKLYYRDEIIALFREEFIENKRTQFELNLVVWTMFSTFSRDKTYELTTKDNEILKRHLNVTSSYVLCAFFLGYYDMKYLKELFQTTLLSLIDLGEGVQSLSLKEKLEYLRIQMSFTDETKDIVAQFSESDSMKKTMFLERYDGTGQRRMNYREMTDLQILLVALNQAYGFKVSELQMHTNLLRDIEIGDLSCEPKVLKMLQRVLYKKPKNILVGQIAG